MDHRLWTTLRTALGRLGREAGQGTVEYVGLILLMGVLIAGVVKASSGFNDTTVADAVVKKLKTAIESVDSGR